MKAISHRELSCYGISTKEETNLDAVLDGIPLLALGNKSDLPNKTLVDELIEALNMKAISNQEVSCYGISAKEETNLDAVLVWLIKDGPLMKF